jgi:hypothetical protein
VAAAQVKAESLPRTNAPAAGAVSPNADGGVVSTKNDDVLLSIAIVPSVARTRQV